MSLRLFAATFLAVLMAEWNGLWISQARPLVGLRDVHDLRAGAAGSAIVLSNNMYPVVRFDRSDKLWLAFNNNDSNGDLSLGLVLWREQ